MGIQFIAVLDHCCQTHFQLKQLGFVTNITSVCPQLSWSCTKITHQIPAKARDLDGNSQEENSSLGVWGQQTFSETVICRTSWCCTSVHFQPVTARGTRWVSRCKLGHWWWAGSAVTAAGHRRPSAERSPGQVFPMVCEQEVQSHIWDGGLLPRPTSEGCWQAGKGSVLWLSCKVWSKRTAFLDNDNDLIKNTGLQQQPGV